MFHNVFKNLPPWHVFHKHEDVRRCLNYLVKKKMVKGTEMKGRLHSQLHKVRRSYVCNHLVHPDDVGMHEQFEDPNFTLYLVEKSE